MNRRLRKVGQPSPYWPRLIASLLFLLVALGFAAAALAGSPTDAGGFNLARCEARPDGLYKCPHLKKPVCAPSASRNRMDCIRAMNRHIFIYIYPKA